MLIIIDKKIPLKAKKSLSKLGEILEIETRNIVYDTISGHPDIFFCQVPGKLIVAPNLPEQYKAVLYDKKIFFSEGELPVGEKYPESSRYNAVASGNMLIHNFRNTDFSITKAAEEMDLIQVDQGYTRCNLISLNEKAYITSDKGIERTLKRYDFEVLYVNPQGIRLPGFDHGFIGGCAGIFNNKIYFTGKLDTLQDAGKIYEFITMNNFEIVELCQEPLFDGGSILFVE